MKRFFCKIAVAGIIFASLAIPTHASALTLTQGTPIVAIDGDRDSNVTVDILSIELSQYTYGYFLNGSSIFHPLSFLSVNTFLGGDSLDFALYNGSRYFTLSGDLLDTTYSVLMNFSSEITDGSPQQPANWSAPYYNNANITWFLPSSLANTNELALNFWHGNDGVAPASVPEPATLIIMGGALAGYGLIRRRKKA